MASLHGMIRTSLLGLMDLRAMGPFRVSLLEMCLTRSSNCQGLRCDEAFELNVLSAPVAPLIVSRCNPSILQHLGAMLGLLPSQCEMNLALWKN